MLLRTEPGKHFRETLFDYLSQGPDYVPFSTLDLKRSPKQASSRIQVASDSFQPFANERNVIGKLQSTQLASSSSEQLRINTEEPQLTVNSPLRRITAQKSMAGPYLTQRIRRPTILPYLQNDELASQRNKSENKFQQDESQKANQICLETKYITELSNHSSPPSNKSLFTGTHYRRNMNIVECGQMKGHTIQQGKPTHHQALLVGRNKGGQSIPGVGVYYPRYNQLDKRKPAIRWSDLVRAKVVETQRSKPVDAPPRQENLDETNFETLYSRTIQQIKREVEQELQRNPYQWLHPNGELVLKTVMTQAEAVEYRDNMQHQLKNMKDSINKIRNMMNMKR